ncbi:MAG: hypothetical protein IPH34_16305 [Chitinophagaceae bacterium]|nr:hypothetical protein [Chitinophagaceae bacterium]
MQKEGDGIYFCYYTWISDWDINKKVRIGLLIGLVLGIVIVFTGWLRTNRK